MKKQVVSTKSKVQEQDPAEGLLVNNGFKLAGVAAKPSIPGRKVFTYEHASTKRQIVAVYHFNKFFKFDLLIAGQPKASGSSIEELASKIQDKSIKASSPNVAKPIPVPPAVVAKPIEAKPKPQPVKATAPAKPQPVEAKQPVTKPTKKTQQKQVVQVSAKVTVPLPQDSDTAAALLLKHGFKLAGVEEKPGVLGRKIFTYDHEATGRQVVVVHHFKKFFKFELLVNGVSELSGSSIALLANHLLDKPIETPVLDTVRLFKKLTSGTFSLKLLAGDDAYTARVQMFKSMGVVKVLVKQSSLEKLEEMLLKYLSVTKAQLATRCKQILQTAKELEELTRQEDAERVAAARRSVAPTIVAREILPIPAKVAKKTKKQLREEKEALRVELDTAMAIREALPIAAPRADADINPDVMDIQIFEDPNNGITLLKVERENSQGAICVYNNGKRVAAGVVAPAAIKSLRRISGDVRQAVHTMLSPISTEVIISPVAERYLNRVLDVLKENEMRAAAAAETTIAKNKKFAAPKADTPASRKSAKAAEEAPVKKGAAAKKSAVPAKKAVAAASNGNGRGAKFEDTATIKATYKAQEPPYREGSARQTLLLLAAKCGNVAKYLKSAGDPTGGSAMSYLSLFVREGHLRIA